MVAVASVFSQMRAVGMPLEMSDPDQPNIAATLWRTISDHDAKRFYFESALKVSVFWVDLDKVDFSPDAEVKIVDCNGPEDYAGEISSEFKSSGPFKFLTT